jgi:uncharacterized protein (TIGR03067 family)
MRLPVLLSLAAALALVALATADEGAKAKGKIEGTYTVISIERNGDKLPEDRVKEMKITITADKIKVKMPDLDHTAEYKLDASKTPATIDFTPQDGDDKGKTGYGIYSVDGDELKFCLAKPGKDRPTEFVSKPGSEVMLIVMKRNKS